MKTSLKAFVILLITFFTTVPVFGYISGEETRTETAGTVELNSDFFSTYNFYKWDIDIPGCNNIFLKFESAIERNGVTITVRIFNSSGHQIAEWLDSATGNNQQTFYSSEPICKMFIYCYHNGTYDSLDYVKIEYGLDNRNIINDVYQFKNDTYFFNNVMLGEDGPMLKRDEGGGVLFDKAPNSTYNPEICMNLTSTGNILMAYGGGNVGIGTYSPRVPLEVCRSKVVNGDSVVAILGAEQNAWTYFGGITNGRIRGSSSGSLTLEGNPHSGSGDKNIYMNPTINSNIIMNQGGGNVGIGTNTPLAPLHITNTTTINNNKVVAIFGSGLDHYTYFGGITGGRIRGSNNDGYLVVESNPAKPTGRLYLNYSTSGNVVMAYGGGKVGIGTLDPLARLHVSSAANSDASILATCDANNKLIVRSGAVTPINATTFTILHEYGSSRDNGYIAFHRGNTSNDGFLELGTNKTSRLLITSAGNIGIGTDNPGTKLDVVGTIRAHEVKVCMNQGCDFVFDKDYKLMSLSELDHFVTQNKHLPEVAPAAIMESEGINLSEMNALLLQKVEELTLYVIELNKEVQQLKAKQ